MKLYKVYQVIGSMNCDVEFITAMTSNDAIKKYIEIKKAVYKLESKFICERDLIIPTTDPRKEMKGGFDKLEWANNKKENC